jgi:Flp pilus assembly protein CpaB
MKKVYLIAVVVALIAGFATYLFASDISRRTTIKDAETIQVVFSIQDLDANKSITEEMLADDAGYFEVKTVIKADCIPNPVTSIDELKEMVTIDKIYAGEQMSKNRIQDINGTEVALSLKLDKGMVAYSFNAASVTSVDGYIVEGDTVDVIVNTKEGSTNKNKSEIAYKDLKIIRVSTSSAYQTASQKGQTITQYSTLTVEVTEEQALQLYEIENNYSFKLVLNPRG